jgi:hypothetical protein
MNVFVLCTGRNGSTSFIKACEYIENYTAKHQSRCFEMADERINFEDNHIESDNRLSWFLGKLDHKYGDTAYYVHLKRNPEASAKSFVKKFGTGMTAAFYPGLITRNINFEDDMRQVKEETQHELCLDMIDTINLNIELFLKDKSKKITIDLENVKDGFETFWNEIGADGDLSGALASWDIRHNANDTYNDGKYTLRPKIEKNPITLKAIYKKMLRTAKSLPKFIKEV